MSNNFVHEIWNSDEQTAKCPVCHAIVPFFKVNGKIKLKEHAPLKEHAHVEVAS
jgi:hypothetical protein